MHTRLIAIAAAIMLGTGSAATARAASDEPVVVDVTAGRNHACLLLDDGAVACWGSNFTGALGTGDRYTRVVPQLVDLPKAATAVVAGGDHTCALLVDGTVACWGRNWEAQLGTGSDSEPVTVPVPVKGLDSVVEIAAGQDHTCALRSDATAWCWGNGGNGQVGPDWNYGMTAPVRVTGVGDVVGLSAGLYQTCLRLEDGTVPCFGFYPREGDNSARSSVPTPVAGFAGAVALAGGESYECAVVPDRTVRCFGYNDYGWLGDGTLTTHPDTDTVAAVGIDTAVDITASFSHACALLEGGSAACWGFESHGELGTPPSEDQWTPVPQPVPGIDGITAISAGWGFTCAVVAGSGLCWGRNEEGELGDRTIVSRPTPAPLSWVPDTTAPTAQAPFIGIRADDKELRGNRVDVRIEPTGADDAGWDRHRPLRAPGQHRRWLDVEPAPFAGQTLQSERTHDRVDDAPVPGRRPARQRRKLADRPRSCLGRPAICRRDPLPRHVADVGQVRLLGRDDPIHDGGRGECHLPVHGPIDRDRLTPSAHPWGVQGLR